MIWLDPTGFPNQAVAPHNVFGVIAGAFARKTKIRLPLTCATQHLVNGVNGLGVPTSGWRKTNRVTSHTFQSSVTIWTVTNPIIDSIGIFKIHSTGAMSASGLGITKGAQLFSHGHFSGIVHMSGKRILSTARQRHGIQTFTAHSITPQMQRIKTVSFSFSAQILNHQWIQ
jgi:hypothetical protein